MNYDIIEMFRDCEEMPINMSLLSYGISVVNSGNKSVPTSSQVSWLRMYKYALSYDCREKEDLRAILVRLFGEPTVSYIDGMAAIGGVNVGSN